VRKKITTFLQEFFTIDNPLLFVSLLCLIIFNRFSLTFFNEGHHVLAPDNYYYAGVTVGEDWIGGTTDQAYRLLKGLPMELTTAYGYSFTILTAWTITLYENIGICSPRNHTACQFLLYNHVVTLVIAGFLILVFLFIKDGKKRAGAILFFLAFLLGIPGGRGIETANLDIILSMLYGCMLYLQKISVQDRKKRYLYPVFIGLIAGVLMQAKIFTVVIGILFLVFSTEPLIFLLSFLVTTGIIILTPTLYGVSANVFQVVQAGQTILGPITTNLYQQYRFGNNNTRTMVGGIVFSIRVLRENAYLREVIIFVGGSVLFLIVTLLPLLTYSKEVLKKITTFSLQDRLSYPFFIVSNCYAIAAIVLWPATSYDYRFFYFLPLIFILLEVSRTSREKVYLGIALVSFIVRCIFILHTKIWHIFLLGFLYPFLLVSVSQWVYSKKSYLSRKRSATIEVKPNRVWKKR